MLQSKVPESKAIFSKIPLQKRTEKSMRRRPPSKQLVARQLKLMIARNGSLSWMRERDSTSKITTSWMRSLQLKRRIWSSWKLRSKTELPSSANYKRKSHQSEKKTIKRIRKSRKSRPNGKRREIRRTKIIIVIGRTSLPKPSKKSVISKRIFNWKRREMRIWRKFRLRTFRRRNWLSFKGSSKSIREKGSRSKTRRRKTRNFNTQTRFLQIVSEIWRTLRRKSWKIGNRNWDKCERKSNKSNRRNSTTKRASIWTSKKSISTPSSTRTTRRINSDVNRKSGIAKDNRKGSDSSKNNSKRRAAKRKSSQKKKRRKNISLFSKRARSAHSWAGFGRSDLHY